MKKTFIALLTLAGVAAGAQNLTIGSSTTGNFDQLNGNNNTECNISVTETATIARIDGSGINNLTTITLKVADDATFTINGYAKLPYNNTSKTYSTAITLGNNSSFILTGILHLGSRNASYTGITQNSTITFGSGASLTAASISTVASAGGTSNLTLNANFAETALQGLADTTLFGKSFERTLITTTNGLTNYSTSNITLTSIKELDLLGYSNIGTITSLDALHAGEYGLLYADNKVKLVGKVIPEPTTATLSLLALCGLAARRRRK